MPYADPKDKAAHRRRYQPEYRLRKPSLNGRMRILIGAETYYALYEALMKKQGGVCAICGKTNGKRRLHMDHNHRTLRIRGLLCYSCNTKLGFVEKYLKPITHYLKEYRS